MQKKTNTEIISAYPGSKSLLFFLSIAQTSSIFELVAYYITTGSSAGARIAVHNRLVGNII